MPFQTFSGRIIVSSRSRMRYSWTFLVTKMSSDMFIGISSNSNVDAHWKEMDYVVNGSRGRRYKSGRLLPYPRAVKTPRFGGGIRKFKVRMAVDFGTKEISFTIYGTPTTQNPYDNHQEIKFQDVVFSNIRIGPTYQLTICLYGTSCVTLNKFVCQ